MNIVQYLSQHLRIDRSSPIVSNFVSFSSFLVRLQKFGTRILVSFSSVLKLDQTRYDTKYFKRLQYPN